jgi:V8-like Glu-specific endopeptidase
MNFIVRFSRFSLCGNNDKVCCRPTKISPVITTTTLFQPSFTTRPTNSPIKNSDNICGIRGLKIEKRVLGNFEEDYDSGNDDRGETQFGEFPWMLAVMKYNKANGQHEYKCGAVLIKKNIALTVTHCVG